MSLQALLLRSRPQSAILPPLGQGPFSYFVFFGCGYITPKVIIFAGSCSNTDIQTCLCKSPAKYVPPPSYTSLKKALGLKAFFHFNCIVAKRGVFIYDMETIEYATFHYDTVKVENGLQGLLHLLFGVLRIFRTLMEWNRTISHDCTELFWKLLHLLF